MKFGLFGGPQSRVGNLGPESAFSYEDYANYVVKAEQLGYSSAWVFEHHFSGFGQPSSTLNLLCYFAGKTNKIRFGSGVVVLPWHNPVLLAEQVATLDVLCGGRYDFGVGRGYRDNEFKGFGINVRNAGEIYVESMNIILRAWNENERWSYKSDRWEFNDIIVEPKPIQNPHPPIWQGAGSRESIRRAARQGHHLLLDQIIPFEEVGKRVAIYKEAIEELGQVFDPYSIGVTRGFMPAANSKRRRDAHSIRNQFISTIKALTVEGERSTHNIVGEVTDETETSEKGAIIGDSSEMKDRVEILYEAGVRNILLHDLTGSFDALNRFADEVMPEFSRRSD